jgi:hypothetical protein
MDDRQLYAKVDCGKQIAYAPESRTIEGTGRTIGIVDGKLPSDTTTFMDAVLYSAQFQMLESRWYAPFSSPLTARGESGQFFRSID